MDEIYKHAVHVCAIWAAQAFWLMNYCGFNVEAFCSDVCGDHRCPQTLAEICRNMDICCGFRAVAVRGKYPGFILFHLAIPIPIPRLAIPIPIRELLSIPIPIPELTPTLRFWTTTSYNWHKYLLFILVGCFITMWLFWNEKQTGFDTNHVEM